MPRATIMKIPAFERVPAWQRPGAILFACLVLGAWLGLTRGLDNWWDVLNYHIYSPWSLLSGRMDRDLFVAGIQGYFYPLADIPYFLLAYRWLDDAPRVVAALAGLPYGVLVYVTLEMVRRVAGLLFPASGPARLVFVAGTVFLAVTGTSAWSQLGSTSNEITISVLVLIAVLAIMRETLKENSLRRPLACAALCGALAGMAAGLKLTAAIYAPGLGLALLFCLRGRREFFLAGLVYCGTWLLAFGLLYGPWAWYLYSRTGNPVFPMFNNIFDSGYIAPRDGRDVRFLPTTVAEWIFYPFYWLDDGRVTVFPLAFRDARIAFGWTLTVAYLVWGCVTRLRGRFAPLDRLLLQTSLFVMVSYVIWLYLFSMLRYGIAIEVLACVIGCAVVAYGLTGAFRTYGEWVAPVMVVALAGGLFWYAVIPDLGHVPARGKAFDARVPPLEKDALVVLANQPMGLVATMIAKTNPTARFVGVPPCFAHDGSCHESTSAYGLGRDMRRALASGGTPYVAYYANEMPSFPQLSAFGLGVDLEHCTLMTTNRTPDVILCRGKRQTSATAAPAQRYHLVATTMKAPGVDLDLTASLSDNACASDSHAAVLTLGWRLPNPSDQVQILLHSAPSPEEKLFAGGNGSGTATTGKWARASQEYRLRMGGRLLARVRLSYAPCQP
jgi:hypothetical protein